MFASLKQISTSQKTLHAVPAVDESEFSPPQFSSMAKKQKPILTGAESHPLWKKALEAECRGVVGLWRHFDGTAIRPKDLIRGPIPKVQQDGKDLSTSDQGTVEGTPDKLTDTEWEERQLKRQDLQDRYDALRSQGITKIIESIDSSHQRAINSLDSPKEQYEKLNLKYEGENIERLHQLARALLRVAGHTNIDVDTKVDNLESLNTAIGVQNPKMKLPEVWLTEILTLSMSEEYETELAIMSAEKELFTLAQVQARLKRKETALGVPPEESANYAGGRRGGERSHDQSRNNSRGRTEDDECYGCNKLLKDLEKGHRKVTCKEFLATNEGKRWIKSNRGRFALFRWKESQDKEKKDEKAHLALASSSSSNGNSSDTESIMSAYSWSSGDDEESEPCEISMPAISKDSPNSPKGWLLDSCCSRHMTSNRSAFVGDLLPSTRQIQCANGESMQAQGKGDIMIQWEERQDRQPKSIRIRNVLYVPDAAENLISLGQLSENGIEFSTSGKTMTLHRGGRTFAQGFRHNRVFHLKQHNYFPKAYSAREVVYAALQRTKGQRLHARLGHPGKSKSEKYAKMVDDLDSELSPCFCESCTLAKITRKIEKKPLTPVNARLECVHMDLCGPFPFMSLQWKWFMLTITCQATGRVWTFFRTNKKELLQVIKDWKVAAEQECAKYGEKEKLQRVHFDRGREFLNSKMASWCVEENITNDPTVGYNPEANGIAERCNRTVMEMANAIRIEAGLGEEYWELAAAAATYLLNRGPTKRLKTMTPWEAWYGDRPSAKRYKVWGCPAYVHIPKEKRKKLAKKAWKGVFVGYSDRNPGIYKIWNTTEKKVVEAKFVIFDELHSRKTYAQLSEENKDEFMRWKMEEGLQENDSSDDEDDEDLLHVESNEMPSQPLYRQAVTTAEKVKEGGDKENGQMQLKETSNKETDEPPPPNLRIESTSPPPVDYTQTSWEEEQQNDGNSDGPPEETNNQGKSSSEISGLDETLGPPDSLGETITVVVQERAVSRPKKAKAVATSASKAPTKASSKTPNQSKPLSKTAQLQKERDERKRAKELADTETIRLRKEAAQDQGWRRGRSSAESANLTKLLKRPRKSVVRLPGRIPIPLTVTEALGSQHADEWQKAIDSEIASIRKNGTFSPSIEKPPMLSDKEIITAKFVFDLKYDPHTGAVVKFKARLVARGFTQIYGVNYEETFAPTMAFDAFRILMATAAKLGWTIRQMDVVTAFLAGKLTETVYLKVPDVLRTIFGDYVQVLKSLYGLKQAARVWFKLLQSFLESIGFTSVPTDESIMINHKTGVHLVIGIYVDDLLITGENDDEIEKVIEQLKKRFEMKDLGKAHIVLGMRILREGRKLTIDQSRYAAEIVAEFYYEDGLIFSTPMDPHAATILETDPGKELMEAQLNTFLRLLGKLNWLCHTRPDVVFSVHKIQQYCARACANHLKALLRVVGYIAGTLSWGLVYGVEREQVTGIDDIHYYTVDHNIEAYAGTSKSDELRIQAYSDTDYATDPLDRKSITGMAIMMNGGVVAFGSSKQKGVSKSTPEAEYIGMSDVARRALWARTFTWLVQGKEVIWDEKGDSHSTPPVPLLYGDNKAAVVLTQGLRSTSKIRHIATSYHHILDEVKHGSLKTYWVPGKDMLADGFTKPLTRILFEKNRDAIGVRDITKVMKRTQS